MTSSLFEQFRWCYEHRVPMAVTDDELVTLRRIGLIFGEFVASNNPVLPPEKYAVRWLVDPVERDVQLVAAGEWMADREQIKGSAA